VQNILQKEKEKQKLTIPKYSMLSEPELRILDRII
jgi:hypothetical protein